LRTTPKTNKSKLLLKYFHHKELLQQWRSQSKTFGGPKNLAEGKIFLFRRATVVCWDTASETQNN